ncbi:MAG TPA: SecC motif-containing protein [Vibrio sp.]|uniref:YecA family protein n=1 Tax=Vibrio TaxID=662 RepID=UPI000ED7A3A7|nr:MULTISPECIES: SEC-C domain-containing protein [Vibrio]HCH01823.1 SecC motif-containing protein [Vibrio sp.]
MKISRNSECPCGSGKKYKRCCMDKVSKARSEFTDEIQAIAAMSPDLSLDDLNIIIQQKADKQNNRPNTDFSGLSSSQMANWFYAPFTELQDVIIHHTPKDISSSPVMRYFSLIVDEILLDGGSLKATTKGNLPAKLVKKASALLSEFPVSQFNTVSSISEFSGSNEDKFNALHYARILAEIAGIIEFKAGRFYLADGIQDNYQQYGLAVFFPLMLETAVKEYNWGYFDHWEDEVPLEQFWLFMLWRLCSHGDLDRLNEEVCIAFPDLLTLMQDEQYSTPKNRLAYMIESRFISRFLEFFGFVMLDPRHVSEGEPVVRHLKILPLLKQTFEFKV